MTKVNCFWTEYQRIRGDGDPNIEFNSALEIDPRTFGSYQMMDNYHLSVRFESSDDEKIFGMGQRQDQQLNMKGCCSGTGTEKHAVHVFRLPFLIKATVFSGTILAIGRATFANNLTEWEAQCYTAYGFTGLRLETHPAEIERSVCKRHRKSSDDAGLRYRFLAVQASL